MEKDNRLIARITQRTSRKNKSRRHIHSKISRIQKKNEWAGGGKSLSLSMMKVNFILFKNIIMFFYLIFGDFFPALSTISPPWSYASVKSNVNQVCFGCGTDY